MSETDDKIFEMYQNAIISFECIKVGNLGPNQVRLLEEMSEVLPFKDFLDVTTMAVYKVVTQIFNELMENSDQFTEDDAHKLVSRIDSQEMEVLDQKLKDAYESVVMKQVILMQNKNIKPEDVN